MVLFVFTIAVVNICVGYKLAVFLGYGPPSLAEGWDAPVDQPPVAAATVAAPSPPPRRSPSPPGRAGSGRLARPRNAIASGATRTRPKPPAETALQLDDTFVETNILKFGIAIVRSGAQMRKIETRLRSREEPWDAALSGRAWPSWRRTPPSIWPNKTG